MKNMNLLGKILLAIMVPLILMMACATFFINQVGTSVGKSMVKQELGAITYSIGASMNLLDKGSYVYDGTDVYKGKVSISSCDSMMDSYKKKANICIAYFCGTDMLHGTFTDANEEMIVIPLDESQVEELFKNGNIYTSNLKVGNKSYYAYYELLGCTGDGKAITMMAAVEDNYISGLYKQNVIQSIVVMSFIALIACAMISVVIIIIVKKITTAVKNLDHVAEGNLTISMDKGLVQRKDEVGNIARNVSSLIQSLSKTMNNIHTSSSTLNQFTRKFQSSFGDIHSSISNVNRAVDEIAHGATNQAEEAMRVNAQVLEMGEAIDSTSQNIESLMQSTTEMASQNEKMTDILRELVELTARTKESLNMVHKQTNVTNDSAKEIGAAVEIITNIAEETNLLSLNASIEAARAGEQGRGFAVVADQVRKLAEQSRDAATEINMVISKLMDNSNISVETMNGVLDDMNHQNDKLTATKETFDELRGEIDLVAGAVENILSEVEHLNTAKSEVLASVDNLSAIAEENAASTQETSATMNQLGEIVDGCASDTNHLVDIAEGLEGNVKKFRL